MVIFLIFNRVGLIVVRLSERRKVARSVVRKGAWVKSGCRVTVPSLLVVLENDRTNRMFNNTHRRVRGQGLEGSDERPFSTVDKSRQGSHSLGNANVCEMFRSKRCSQ